MLENFRQLRPGHWHQTKRTGPGPVYSYDYSNYYNRIPSEEMSRIRYHVLKDYIKDFNSVCDFGYGNGSFLEYCRDEGHACYAYDISDYPAPVGVTRLNNMQEEEFDVVTFFDSLEHIEDADLVSFLNSIKSKYFVVSVPWLHEFLGKEWFSSWKHKKDNEHFHYFDAYGLVGLLVDANCTILHIGNEEDQIRKSADQWPNILTVVAKRNV